MRKHEDIITVAVVNFRTVWGNKESNLARIKGYIENAAKRGANLIVFPEMSLNGYENETEVEKIDKMQIKSAELVPGPSSEIIAEVTRQNDIYAVFGMAERDPQKAEVVYNAACVCGPDGIVGTYRKLHPALEEQCWCTRGNEPFSFETRWGKVGVGICYDSYNFHELMRYYAASGARLYLNPTAIGPGPRFDWRDYYLTGLKQGVNVAELYIASSNLVGFNQIDEEEGGSNGNVTQSGCFFGGGSMILGPGIKEKIHTYAGDVDNAEENIVMETIDLSLAGRRNFKVDAITGRPDYRPDLYMKLNKMLLEDPYWKQFADL